MYYFFVKELDLSYQLDYDVNMKEVTKTKRS
jgi:hypothetical protein